MTLIYYYLRTWLVAEPAVPNECNENKRLLFDHLIINTLQK